jgi:hypothetical protein
MRINTKTEKVELTRTEMAKLDGAHSVVSLLVKHGGGDVASLAEDACKAIGLLLAEIRTLSGKECLK